MAHRLWHEKAALARGIEYGSLRVRSEAEGQWKKKASATRSLHNTAPKHPRRHQAAPMREKQGSSAIGAAGAGSWAARGGVQVSSARRVGQCCQPLGPFKILRVPPTLVVLGRNSHIVHSHLGACDARLRACGLATELICQCPVGAGGNENEFNGGASQRANSRCASTPRPAAVFRRWNERSSGIHRSFP